METSLAIITDGGADIVAMFTDGGAQIDPILSRIEAEVRLHSPDLTTKKGRDAIASLAYKVSQSKTALDTAGKSMTEAQKKEIKLVDDARKKIRDRLDALRDEARKPLNDWEAEEADKKARVQDTLDALRGHGINGGETPDEIKAAADTIKAIVIGDDFGPSLEIANLAREASLTSLRTMYSAAVQRDKDAEELTRLRAAAEARVEADRVAAETAEAERIAKEQAERAEADRIAAKKAEIERAAQVEADKLAAAKAATIAAEEAAAVRQINALAQHQLELDAVTERANAAAQAERALVAAQAKATAEAQAQRMADASHLAKITADIVNALRDMTGNATPELIAEALIEGQIPHCEVTI
jgi:hypothetical protein